MNKLVKLAGQVTRSHSAWARYLWRSMRHNERSFRRQSRMARERMRLGYPGSAGSHGMLAVSYARSADLEWRLLGL
jgi:hypothetical protein